MAEELSGRELDAEIARLLGWRWMRPITGMAEIFMPPDKQRSSALNPCEHPDNPFAWQMPDLPLYSSDPAAARDLREILRKRGWLVQLKLMPDGFPWRNDNDEIQVHKKVYCELLWMGRDTSEDVRRRMKSRCFGFGDTEEEATARACLQALRAEKESA